MKKVELLNEIMGVPKDLDPWIESLTKLLLDEIKSEIRGGWAEEGRFNYTDPNTGEQVEDFANKSDDVEISGSEVMDFVMKDNGFSEIKDFLNSKMFQSLPIWKPRITFNVVGIPSIVLKQEDGTIQASVGGEITQKLSKLGKHMVLSKLYLDFNVIIEKEGMSTKDVNELRETIAHELLHVYQKCKQLKAGKDVHFGKETALNAVANNTYFREIGIDWWRDFLNLVYLHLSFEINARIEQLYYKLKNKDIKTTDDFVRELHKSEVWRQMKMLEDFNAEEYLKSFQLPSAGSKRNPLYMLHKLMRDTQLKSMGVDTSSKDSAIKSLINLWDTVLENGVKGIQSVGVDISMDKVPQKAKEDPYVFFKFFEKRFHKKAETWKKKMYRVGALILQENNEGTLQ